MTIRAGASDPEMAQSLGINIRWLHALVFAAGVALAALAGMIAAPVSSVFPGMGNQVLIVCDKNVVMLSQLAHRCVILVKGRKVFDAPPAKFNAEPGLRTQYLGV